MKEKKQHKEGKIVVQKNVRWKFSKEIKERNCLRCNKLFKPNSSYYYICENCKTTREWVNDWEY